MCKGANLSSRVSSAIANQFYRLGVLIAQHPWKVVATSLLFLAGCSIGFIKFEIETNPLELWVPKDSQFLHTTKWVVENIEYGFRPQSVLTVAPNVLEPKVLQKLAHARLKVVDASGKLRNGAIIKWQDVCLKIPFIIGNEAYSRKTRSTDKDRFEGLFEEADNLKKATREFNPSVDLSPAVYCKLISNLPWGCFEKSILELWNYDLEKINKLTLPEVIMALNNITVSPVTGHATKFDELLGEIERDQNGQIIAARALQNQWFLYLNFTAVKDEKVGNLAGTETWITPETSAWENAYLKEMQNLDSSDSPDNRTKMYYAAAKSFGDISYESMFQETNKLGVGVIMMFVFVQIVLSKFSWTEMRITLGSLGLLTILFSFACTCGICSAIGIPYGPVHTSLPFLLMGLGVDDLFIMMACWKKVKDEQLPLEERMGLMLKHAGASITVTSLTDIIAFVVGSLTVIPSLQSFCLYAAIGVFATYFYAVTFFVAIFTLDEYRIQANRNAFFPCIVHKEAVKPCCDLNLMHKCLNFVYSKFVLTKPGKVIVLLTVIGLTSISTLNLLELKQKFDPTWFIPERTYLHKYIMNMRRYFPEAGYQGSVFMGRLNYTESFPHIAKLVDEFEQNDLYFYDVDSWVKPFAEFVKKYYYKDLRNHILTDHEWRFYLSKFLWSPIGGKYQAVFRFDKPLKCGEPSGNVTVSIITFRFKKFTSRDVYVPAMYELNDMIKRNNITTGDGFVQPWAIAFANWITDEIIDREVYRNVILATVCVMLCTIIVIVDIQVCFWIFICVSLTLVNVGGFMHLWGLTIDLVSCIGLQLAIGLCVDYAAHIGHNFLLIADGDRNKRMLDAVLHIGAAVLYGGASTLLALLLLSRAEAYTFQSFFKIFFLVIVFGIFHGVVFLPVVLSTIGPKPYKIVDKKKHKENPKDEEEMKPINNGQEKSK